MMEGIWGKTSMVAAVVVLTGMALADQQSDDTTEAPIPPAIFEYMARREGVFEWQLREKVSFESGTIYDVDLTSQCWQDVVWRHVLQIYEPPRIEYPEHILLFVTGGTNDRRPGRDNVLLGTRLASLCGARVAMLFQVPNQPLLDGRREDDLISETWLRFLETGDPNWPLLFPMVKSVVKAMDAIEQIAASQWGGKVAGFVVTGASKRGWTSWLTPVVDKRVVATAPIVINVLNFRPQMQHQLDTWGKFSEQLYDYTSKGLIKVGEETPREALLRQMMDPYTYRRQLQLPKLIINGTNDRYWVVDAARFYWHDLVGPKYLLEVPNAGHGLEGGRELAIATLCAFFRHVVEGQPMPAIEWDHTEDENSLILRMRSDRPPTNAQLWVAFSENKDFRESRWSPRPMEQHDGQYVGRVDIPLKSYIALFGQFTFQKAGLPFALCSLIRVYPDSHPKLAQ